MVKSILIVLCLYMSDANANLFDFSSDKGRESKIPTLVANLKKLEVKEGPAYEETFNDGIKAIENGIEEEKLYCSGEATDAEGKALPKDQKQLCMRELKKHYLEATTVIFDLKKKYLGFIHQKQVEKLTEIQTKLKADIEKNF
ncbi:MAG: hypothetical protein NDI69_03575 [Bacteriovoracaceae bacterium]|nr:hypothetical protein [Bacteriovoracaceae bacterium]